MYQFYFPTPALAPFIENYWVLRVDASQQLPVQEAIFVDGKADILFNFGVAYTRTNLNGTHDLIKRSNLDAQRSYPVSIVQHGAVHLLGVRFRLAGMAAFLRLPMNALSDSVIELRDVFGQAADDLETRLYEAIHLPLQQVALLDDFFMKRLIPHEQHRLVFAATNYMLQQPQLPTIESLSDNFGYSIRSVNRFFQHLMGFSPKWMARVVRLHHVLHALSLDTQVSLSEVALNNGYFDQAHFSKEFKEFTGQTPSDYRLQLLLRRAELPPNLVQFLQDEPTRTP